MSSRHAPGEDRPYAAAACPSCGEAFDLHQPDGQHPDLQLGVCCDCRLWALIDGRDGTVVELIAVRLSRGPAPRGGRRAPTAETIPRG